MIINLDLDGVFADMESSVKSLAGFEYNTDPKVAWSVVDKVDKFFYHLQPLAGAIDLFHTIQSRSRYPIRILTALPLLTGKLITAERDKRAWVAKYLSPYIEVVCVNSWKYKRAYCREGDILVDDSSRNVADWVLAGGYGILHLNNNPENTLEDLKEYNVFV
jgi:hypothetical protein